MARDSKGKGRCWCFIHHATTPEEKEEAARRLEYFKSMDDERGGWITELSLEPCPGMVE